jgi:DNA-binding MarR family transcriptional regulator
MSIFDYKQLDDLVHSRVRLAAMAYLAGSGRTDFAVLQTELDVTHGNLSAQLRKLEDAGLVLVGREIRNRRAWTVVELTDAGRRALRDHVERLSLLIEAAKGDSS